MQKEIIELFEKSNETVMESARRFAELNMRTFDKLFQQQVELTSFYMDASARSMELITKARGYQDLIAGQTALARECGERGIAAVRTGMTEIQSITGEYGSLVQDGMNVAKKQMTEATDMAMKAAV